ncbi:MAG: acetate/propionate family kinase [Acidobacteriota bacterium]|nr:MAG: acetate/propionate family kinase [Acidobacteriota bacterium]
MNLIVCNIGSSSLKFQLIEMPVERQIARGHFERVGTDQASVRFWIGEEETISKPIEVQSQRQAVQFCLDLLTSEAPVLRLEEIGAVGFKCVQGGEKNGSLLLEQDVLDAMEYYRDLAPAHNPPYLEAIYMFRELLPGIPLVGVFEPGFHTEAPEYAKIYGTPWDWISRYGVRKYGYHGASHRFTTAETVKLAGLPPENHRVITCHLGGSSSLCAFQNGRAIDTSMGFTPQTGLIQGTRIGDLDPFALPYIMRKKGITLEQALADCSKEAGLAGLSGTSGDMRDIVKAIEQGSERAQLARDKFIYDVKRYIGEFLVLMEGLDAITFTGGIGQKDADLRARVLSALHFLGLELDKEANQRHEQKLTTPGSRIEALVIETNEEIVVARETLRVVDEQEP